MVVIGMACLILAVPAGAADFEEASIAAPFLKIAAGARAAAMGEAFTAVADDANALAWNPAGLGRVKKTEIHFTHNQWLVDTRLEQAVMAIPYAGCWALGYSVVDLGEMAEWAGPGTPRGHEFRANDQVISGGYGRPFLEESVFLGASFKYIREDIGLVEGETVTADFGALYAPWQLVPGLTFAAVVQNAGGSLSGFELPLGLRLGTAYKFENVLVNSGIGGESSPDSSRAFPQVARQFWEPESDSLTLSTEVFVPARGRAEVHAGMEYWLSIVALRAGYRYRIPRNELGGISGLTLGFGIRGRSLQFDYGFDYAYAPYGNLGDASRYSLSVAF